MELAALEAAALEAAALDGGRPATFGPLPALEDVPLSLTVLEARVAHLEAWASSFHKVVP